MIVQRPSDTSARASSTSASMKSTMPLTSACLSRSSTGASRQASVALAGLRARRLHRLGELDQPFGGVGPAIEQHVFDVFEQILGNLLVDRELAGVDDAHVQAGADGVVEEGGVHRLAHHVVAAERERDVADAAGDLAPRAIAA